MFILPAMLMIILGSVLLPTQEKKETDMQLTMKNFIYYQVTPGVKAYVNGQETTIYAIRVVQDPLTGESQLQFTKGAIETPEQETYIRSLFKSKRMQQAWFIRLVLPEGELAKYYISIEAQNGQRASDYIALKYVKINLPEFDEKGNMYTDEKYTSVFGSITPGLNLKVMSRNQELPNNLNKQTGEFNLERVTLKGKNNAIQFILSDEVGLSKTISRRIKYTGVFVNVRFTNKSTLNPKAKLTGTATPGSLVEIYKAKNQKLQLETTINVPANGKINLELPIEPGLNQYQVLAVDQEENKSPKTKISITRRLTG